MLSFFQKIKFNWEYVILGLHRLSPERLLPNQPTPPKLDWHFDSLVGDYVRTENQTWWSDTKIEGLDYPVTLSAVGSHPTIEQVKSFENLIKTLPALIASSELEEAPQDDGWGNRPPPFSFNTAPLAGLTIYENGSFGVDFEFEDDTPYLAFPIIKVAPDMSSITAEWLI